MGTDSPHNATKFPISLEDLQWDLQKTVKPSQRGGP